MLEALNHSWCDHHFVVRRKKADRRFVHRIYVLDNGEMLLDEISNDQDRSKCCILQTPEKRLETYWDNDGQMIGKREIASNDPETIKEEVPGFLRSEKRTEQDAEGRITALFEKLYRATVLHSEGETRYNSDGTASSVTTIYFAEAGKPSHCDKVLYHATGTPAIAESTRYRGDGLTGLHVKTVYTAKGNPLWQETTHYPDAGTKPSKKELVIFTRDASKTFVNVTQFAEDGTACKRELLSLDNGEKTIRS